MERRFQEVSWPTQGMPGGRYLVQEISYQRPGNGQARHDPTTSPYSRFSRQKLVILWR